ncbi:unnamed protein product [Ceratitis capitata]|uniref:(Mediterranean fruit fly) hypothetical protein n=1 Tax=Ceratitis capitata TaxID=7213 RepID=A0A811VKA4_CERCA|nr:unnamed protein product [Ceratitis capitata]
MWSNALCTLGVTKPLCNCLSIRQVAAAAAAAASQGAAITTGPTSANSNTAGYSFIDSGALWCFAESNLI